MTSRYPDSAESQDHHPERYHESSGSRGHRPGSPNEHQRNSDGFEPYDEPYDRRMEPEHPLSSDSKIPQRDSSSEPTPSPSSNIKIEESFDSPSGIADIRADMTSPIGDEEGFEVTLPGIIETRRSSDNEDFPFDEDNPAENVDDIRMSPLPYDYEEEDPTTLLLLPENLLKLPISPVGPQDQEDEI